MRRNILAVSITAATILGLGTPTALAQSRTTRGTVTHIQGNTLTVKVGDRAMAFTVERDTIVTADGAGTASRAAAAAGRSGPKLSDLIRPGDAVEVMFREMNGARRVNKIRRTRTPGGRTTEETVVETTNGTVETVAPGSITLSTGSALQTFVIDRDTKVVARGAGAVSRARDGGVTVPDLVAVGNRVTVTYHRSGDALHAAEIRVR